MRMETDILRSCSMLKFIFSSLLMVIIARIKAKQLQCTEIDRYILLSAECASLLPEEIISSHNVEPDVQVNCNFLCFKKPKCVAFNFKTKHPADEHAINCQLSNSTKKKNNRDGDWTFFHSETKKTPAGTNCASLYKSGARTDGLYTINPDGLGSFQVRCDMTTDGGGWTVFQRRQDGSEDFYRGWSDYKDGFGDLNKEFWLGLDKIHRLTNTDENTLRVDLMDFDDDKAHAKYDSFTVASELDSYKLSIDGFSGTGGPYDSLSYNNEAKFSTRDNDNDGRNCPVDWKGAWWYRSCSYSNLNGMYLTSTSSAGYPTGITWYYWKSDWRSMKKSEMKIRPAQF